MQKEKKILEINFLSNIVIQYQIKELITFKKVKKIFK